MSIPPSVFPVAFENLNDFFEHVKIQGNEKENGHSPDHRNIKVQRIKINAGKMLCGLVQVRRKVKEVQWPVLVNIDRKDFLDQLPIIFYDPIR